MQTVRKVYIELEEPSITKILNGLKILGESGIKYSVLEENPNPILTTTAPVKSKDVNYEKKMGRHGLMILKLLYEGLSYKEIAIRTDISINGVRYYIKKIFAALEVNSSRDAVRVYVTKIANMQNSSLN